MRSSASSGAPSSCRRISSDCTWLRRSMFSALDAGRRASSAMRSNASVTACRVAAASCRCVRCTSANCMLANSTSKCSTPCVMERRPRGALSDRGRRPCANHRCVPFGDRACRARRMQWTGAHGAPYETPRSPFLIGRAVRAVVPPRRPRAALSDNRATRGIRLRGNRHDDGLCSEVPGAESPPACSPISTWLPAVPALEGAWTGHRRAACDSSAHPSARSPRV